MFPDLNTALSLCLAVTLASPVMAGQNLDEMYSELKTAPAKEAKRIGREIRLELGKSGSPSMNLLLKRGRSALEAGDAALGIQLLGALTDHAPEFAEGWHALSVAHARTGMMGPAMADLRRSLALEPRNFAAIYSLAALLEEIGMPDLAQEAYARVVAIHPHFDDVEDALARLGADLAGTDL